MHRGASILQLPINVSITRHAGRLVVCPPLLPIYTRYVQPHSYTQHARRFLSGINVTRSGPCFHFQHEGAKSLGKRVQWGFSTARNSFANQPRIFVNWSANGYCPSPFRSQEGSFKFCRKLVTETCFLHPFQQTFSRWATLCFVQILEHVHEWTKSPANIFSNPLQSMTWEPFACVEFSIPKETWV